MLKPTVLPLIYKYKKAKNCGKEAKNLFMGKKMSVSLRLFIYGNKWYQKTLNDVKS